MTHTSLKTRLNVANRAYGAAWDATRAMANAAPVLMGPPQAIGSLRVYAAYPRYTREQIGNSARRCNRMFRAIARLRVAAKGAR